MTNSERIIAIAEGRKVGETCPRCNGSMWSGTGTFSDARCVSCNGTGRIRTTPEGPVELAVAELRAEFDLLHGDEPTVATFESIKRERDQAHADLARVTEERDRWHGEMILRGGGERSALARVRDLEDRLTAGAACAAHDLTVDVLRGQNATLMARVALLREALRQLVNAVEHEGHPDGPSLGDAITTAHAVLATTSKLPLLGAVRVLADAVEALIAYGVEPHVAEGLYEALATVAPYITTKENP